MRQVCFGKTLLVALVGVVPAVGQESASFLGTTLDISPTTSASVLVDLDDDGLLDLVVGSDEPIGTCAQIAWGDGAGSFIEGPVVKIGTTGIVRDLTAGDVNGDGRPDVVGVVDSSVLHVSLNAGGALAPLLNLPLTGAEPPHAVKLGDYDGDGILDAVVVIRPDVIVLSGRGDGTFEPPVSVYSGNLPRAIEVADVNSDGALDLVLCDQFAAKIDVLLGAGDGTFATSASLTVTAVTDITLADFDDDGALDIGASSATAVSPSVVTFLGVGDGTFGSPTATASERTSGIVAGDYDGDGIVDLVATVTLGTLGSSPQYRVLVGAGDGTFTLGDFGQTLRTIVDITPADLNGDLTTDWLVTQFVDFFGIPTYGGVQIALGREAQMARFPAWVDTTGAAVITADLNADGLDDLVASRGTSGVYVSLATSNGFAAEQFLDAGMTIRHATTGDVDGDGIVDIIGGELAMSGFVVFNGLGGGAFAPAKVTNLVQAGGVSAIAAGDLDGDGKAEVIAAMAGYVSPGALYVLRAGAGGALELIDVIANVEDVTTLILEDFDGDGWLDLVDVAADGTSHWRRGSVAMPQFVFTISMLFPADTVGVFTTSILGDDGLHLIVVGPEFVFLAVASIGAQSGVFFSGPLTDLPFTPDDAALLDFNGDGHVDLVITSEDKREVVVLRGDSLAQFEISERVADEAKLVVAGTFNADGLDDFVAIGAPRGRLYLRQDGLPWAAVGGGVSPLGDARPTLRGSGDPSSGSGVSLAYEGGLATTPVALVIGLDEASVPLKGGILVPTPELLLALPSTNADGDLALDLTWPVFTPGIRIWTQGWQLTGGHVRASTGLTVESR